MKKFFKIIFTLVLLISSFGCNKEEVSSSEEINLVKLEELSEYSWISELDIEDIEYIELKDVKWVYEIYVSYNQADFEKIIDFLDCYVEVPLTAEQVEYWRNYVIDTIKEIEM